MKPKRFCKKECGVNPPQGFWGKICMYCIAEMRYSANPPKFPKGRKFNCDGECRKQFNHEQYVYVGNDYVDGTCLICNNVVNYKDFFNDERWVSISSLVNS